MSGSVATPLQHSLSTAALPTPFAMSLKVLSLAVAMFATGAAAIDKATFQAEVKDSGKNAFVSVVSLARRLCRRAAC